MKLDADKPRMIRTFADFGKLAVGRLGCDNHAGLFQLVLIFHIDFVAVTMALGNFVGAVNLMNQRIFVQDSFVGAQTHCAAQIAVLMPNLFGAILVPFGHQADHRLAGLAKLCGAGGFDAGDIAHGFNDRQLHAETNS